MSRNGDSVSTGKKPDGLCGLSGLLQLAGRRFRVTRSFDEAWCPGDCGLVNVVAFDGFCWSVAVMREGDRCYTHLAVAEFLAAVEMAGPRHGIFATLGPVGG